MGAETVQSTEKKEDDRYKLRAALFLLAQLLMGCIPTPEKGTIKLFEWCHFPLQMGMD